MGCIVYNLWDDIVVVVVVVTSFNISNKLIGKERIETRVYTNSYT